MLRLLIVSAALTPLGAQAQSAAHDPEFVARLNQALIDEGLSEVVASHNPGTEIYASATDEAETEIEQSTRAIRRVGTILADSFCGSPGRPSTVTYSISASFQVVVGVETGTEVTWDIDKVCERLGR